MQINYFCPRWGSEDMPWDDFLSAVKQAGYNGVEIGIPEDENTKAELLEKIEGYKLKFIAQHWETNDRDFNTHKKSFRYHLERLVKTNPFQVNSHTGKDYFTAAQNGELLKIAEEISAKSDVCITHETHRGRFSFASHLTTPYFTEFPKLQITLDVSHWICVAESLLFDQQEAIESCLPHTKHIHARMGHTQGPQVDDPRLEKWQQTAERHFEIWDSIVEYNRANGTKEISFTTEFGPIPYMPTVPAGKSASGFQFELNVYILKQLIKRYKCST